jgi:tRNA(Ile2) C34 agmatinyltransferase TiaS
MQQFGQEVLGVVAVVLALVIAWAYLKSHPKVKCPKCDGRGEFRGKIVGGFKDCSRCGRSGRVLRPSLRIASFFSTGLRQRYADIPR